MRRVDFTGATLHRGTLTSLQGVEADPTNADLSYSSMVNASPDYPNMTGAHLTAADLSGPTLDLAGVIWSNTTCRTARTATTTAAPAWDTGSGQSSSLRSSPTSCRPAATHTGPTFHPRRPGVN